MPNSKEIQKILHICLLSMAAFLINSQSSHAGIDMCSGQCEGLVNQEMIQCMDKCIATCGNCHKPTNQRKSLLGNQKVDIKFNLPIHQSCQKTSSKCESTDDMKRIIDFFAK